MFTIYKSDFINNPGNCSYHNRIEVTDIASLKEAISSGYEIARKL